MILAWRSHFWNVSSTEQTFLKERELTTGAMIGKIREGGFIRRLGRFWDPYPPPYTAAYVVDYWMIQFLSCKKKQRAGRVQVKFSMFITWPLESCRYAYMCLPAWTVAYLCINVSPAGQPVSRELNQTSKIRTMQIQIYPLFYDIY